MRILIVSRTPWDNNNSFGNTFSNLFGGMEDVEIYNICCQSGNNNNSIVKASFQITDKEVLDSIWHGYAGHVSNYKMQIDNALASGVISTKKRGTILYAVRDIMWKLGKWKSDALNDFISEVNPDIIYLPIYRSGYMIDVDEYVISKCSAPAVAHITDDVYGYAPFKLSSHLYQSWLRKKLNRLINKCEYGEAFAQNMVDEYPKIFKIPFYLIGKGIDTNDIPPYKSHKTSNAFRFLYSGNYGGERGQQLVNLANAIAKVCNDTAVSATLDIYSLTQGDEVIDKQLKANKNVRLLGGVASEVLRNIQNEADILVHVEGFSKKAIHDSRMSFSTKLIDYMLVQRPILAIGSKQVNSIQTLMSNDCALVATNNTELQNAVSGILSSAINTDNFVHNAVEYLKRERDIKTIQHQIYNRFKTLVNR